MDQLLGLLLVILFGNSSEGNIDNIGRDGFTKEQRKYYDDEIENASTDEIADKIRYERNKVSRENRGLKPYDSYDDWYKTVERIRILLFRQKHLINSK